MHNNSPDWLSIVREKVETLRYGVVQIVIHDSKVTQIERTERTRIVSPEIGPLFQPTRQTGGTNTNQNVAPDHRRSFLSNRFLHYDLYSHQTIAWVAPRSCCRVSNPLAPNGQGRRPVSRAAPPPPPVTKIPEGNFLSFWDGRLVIDIEERVRVEWRENTRDFDSSISDDNDDSWILNRFRFGLAVKPVSWLRVYGQSQDSREADSDRANIPGIRSAEGDDQWDLRQGYIALG